MGGAAGHISHIWENQDFTFNDIVDILSSAATGKLENVVEKFDGMQVMFTHNGRELRFARNKSEMISGGLTQDDLIAKFASKSNVRDAFVTGYAVLNNAVSVLPKQIKTIFSGGSTWYSAEIMCSKNRNVISYDKNVIVFHEFPTFNVNNGAVAQINGWFGVDILKKNINSMQAAASMLSWQVHAPEMFSIQRLTDGTALKAAIDELHNVAMMMNCTMGHTIGAYLQVGLRRAAMRELSGLPQTIIDAVVSRCLEHSGCQTLTQIKKTTPTDYKKHVSDFVSSSADIIKRLLFPIERAVIKFTTELLRGVKSAFLADSSAETERLKSELVTTIAEIEATGDASLLDALRVHVSKIENIGDVHVGTEGVIFVYKNRAYKFTGCFGPINQVLGMLRYKR